MGKIELNNSDESQLPGNRFENSTRLGRLSMKRKKLAVNFEKRR
jgi:hypothetical protein